MTTRRHPFLRSRRTLGLASVLAFGCGLSDKNLGEIGGTTGEGNDSQGESTDDGASGQADATAGSETGESGGDPIGCVPSSVDPPECHEDPDHDTIRAGCDNAPDHFNPDQIDTDNDGIGDLIDSCATVASAIDAGDADKDGVGDDCDVCRRAAGVYNGHDPAVSVPEFMLVRNIPGQGDADEDGIGDACDNCVVLANCQDYGPEHPYEVGDPIADDDAVACQRDDDGDLVGDACEGQMIEGAAGPVGLGQNDDFDQDGIVNTFDLCPRQPLPARIDCTPEGDECGADSVCHAGVCNHVDVDHDAVGDVCDSCPVVMNPGQTMDGAAQEEDADGDFVGNACETVSTCSTIADPPPLGFYEVSARGRCCTVRLFEGEDGYLRESLTEQPLVDPDGLPISVDCDEGVAPEALTCRKLPPHVASTPGVLTLPPGCDEALDAAGISAEENQWLWPDAVEGQLTGYWDSACTLPQWDQDYDGLGDPCDLCTHMFDPENQAYIDDNGTVWPEDGKYCNGFYDPDAICEGLTDTE